MTDILTSLADSSLVEAETRGDEPRFGLLETIREYALGRLRDHGAWQQAHDRHAAYFTALARPAEYELRGDGQLAWLNRLETEAGNLSAALSWLMDQDQLDQAITFIWMTWRFWWLHGHVAELAQHWQSSSPRDRKWRRTSAPWHWPEPDSPSSPRATRTGPGGFRAEPAAVSPGGDELGAALAAAALGHCLPCSTSTHGQRPTGTDYEPAPEADTGSAPGRNGAVLAKPGPSRQFPRPDPARPAEMTALPVTFSPTAWTVARRAQTVHDPHLPL